MKQLISYTLFKWLRGETDYYLAFTMSLIWTVGATGSRMPITIISSWLAIYTPGFCNNGWISRSPIHDEGHWWRCHTQHLGIFADDVSMNKTIDQLQDVDLLPTESQLQWKWTTSFSLEPFNLLLFFSIRELKIFPKILSFDNYFPW